MTELLLICVLVAALVPLARRQLRRERQRAFAWQMAELQRRIEAFGTALGTALLPAIKEAAAAMNRFAEALSRISPGGDGEPA